MISSTTWVPKGFASEFPEKYELNDEEMERINQLAQLNLNDAKTDLLNAQQNTSSTLQNQLEVDDDLKEFDLEHYDDSEDNDEMSSSMFPVLSDETKSYENEDQYISLPTNDDILEDKQELQIYPSDNLVLATRTEDDISYLDVYVYDDGAGFHDETLFQDGDKQDPDVARGLVRDSSLYVHHDLMLPAFPLCVEWINYKPGNNNGTDEIANFAAIGTFDPSIEIWNLDCVDKAFPDMILGEPVNSVNSSSKNTKKTKKHISTHHTDAVLSLSHNKQFRTILASTSADHTVKLWDLDQGIAVRSMNSLHSNKNVSSSQWHSTNGSILLTGGYDSRVSLTDVRISEDTHMSKYWSVVSGEEVECVKFANENCFVCGTDNGNIYSFDLRNGENSKPLWTLKAHDMGISSLEVNQFIPNMIITSSVSEKVVKLWKCPMDPSLAQSTGPSMVLSRDFGVGNVLTTSFAADIEVAGNISIGGVNPGLKLWDVFTNRSVRKCFSSELENLQQRAKEEANQLGRSSRIARKYIHNDNPDTVVTVDDVSEDDEENNISDEND